MTAASPGLVPVFQTNRHYPTHEAYVEAIAAAMQEEYEAIVEAGFVLQLDCPDLAMAHHTSFQDLSEADFLKRAAFHVEVLNHALRNVPADRTRIHICWGNYEGPHDHDIDFAQGRADPRQGQAAWRWSSRPPTRATRMNGRCGRRPSCPTTRS